MFQLAVPDQTPDGPAALTAEEACGVLEARMREGEPDVFRVVRVTDGTGRHVTGAYLLNEGVSTDDAAPPLADLLSRFGRPVTEEEVREMANDVMNAEETVRRLRACGMKITRGTLRLGLKQRVFPFGDCVETEGGGVVYIYRLLLEAWIAERFGGAET